MSGARKSLDGLASKYSLLDGMPAVYRSDRFMVGLIDGFDSVLAPVHAATDHLDSYLDPAMTPPDFLDWLGTWLGLVVDRRWPIRRRREFVAKAIEVYRWRGTARGIAEAVELYTGTRPEVVDSGAVVAGPEPLGDIPGSDPPTVTVRVRSEDPSTDADVIDRIVSEVKPAHVRHQVEVVAARS
ncbi:MAG: phage tail protein [Actinomycetota bacterium]